MLKVFQQLQEPNLNTFSDRKWLWGGQAYLLNTFLSCSCGYLTTFLKGMSEENLATRATFVVAQCPLSVKIGKFVFLSLVD